MLENLVIVIVLGLPIFFLIKRILKSKIPHRQSRNIASFVGAFTLAPAMYIAFIIGFFSYTSHYPKNNFDETVWESNIEERFTMSKDIVRSKMLIGKTKGEVIEILGEDFSENMDGYMTYYLGFVPGFLNIDPDVLDIHFENKKVIRVEQRRT